MDEVEFRDRHLEQPFTDLAALHLEVQPMAVANAEAKEAKKRAVRPNLKRRPPAAAEA